MPPEALAFALAAAVVQATWNLVLAGARDSEAAAAVALCAGWLVAAPAAAALWRVEPEAWPYIAGSAAFELAYFMLLGAAYHRSEISLVYPLARGVSPVIVLAIGVAALGVATSWPQAVGVCAVGVGVILVRGIRRRAGSTSNGATLGLLLAGCIAGFTLVDKQGIEHANPVAYMVAVMALPAILYTAGVARFKGPAALRGELRPTSLAVGVGIFTGYLLVLAALRLGPAAGVAAVREASILIVTAFAALVLKERVGLARAVGAVLVVGGVALLGLN